VRYRHEDEDIEMLDVFRGRIEKFTYSEPDQEMRAMQVSHVTLHDPRTGSGTGLKVEVWDRGYSLHAADAKIEASLLARCAIVWGQGSDQKRGTLPKYHLHRRFTLEDNVSYLREEISVTAADGSNPRGGPPQEIEFSVGYFAHMDIGRTPSVRKDSRGWLAIEWTDDQRFVPEFGYGFACNTAIRDFKTPVPEYPFPDKEHKSFAWETARCAKLKVIHLFTYGNRRDLNGKRIESLWSKYLRRSA
jgi:hypothetical protein